MSRGKSVEAYIAGLGDWRGEVVAKVRGLVRESAPGVTESIKWGQPIFEDGGPIAYVRAFGEHVNFGFWRGAELPDPKGLLEGEGDRMRHVKLTGMKDIKVKAFKDLVRAAVELNRRRGDPTKPRRL